MATYDSLMLGGHFELLGPGGALNTPGGGTPSKDPKFPGVVFSLQPGYSLGEPQTTVDILAPLLGDGERPYGRRASNRTVSLPVYVIAPFDSAGNPGFGELAAGVEALMYTCDADVFTLVWTRRQGLDPQEMPLVFDCFRAGPATVQWGGIDEVLGNAIAVVTLTISALPYGRSDAANIIDFQSSLSTVAAPPSPVQLDTFTVGIPDAWTPSLASPSGVGQSAYWDAFADTGYFLSMNCDGASPSPSVQIDTNNSTSVTPGNSYRAYFYAMSLQGWSSGCYLAIQWYNGGTFLSQSVSPTSALSAGSPVLLDTGTVTAPASSTACQLVVTAVGTPSRAVTFLIAGGPYGGGTLLSDPPTPGGSGGGWTGGNFQSGNFLTGQNTGFEGGLGNWVTTSATSGITDSNAQAHSGVDSMAMTSTGAGTNSASSCAAGSITTQGLPVQPGETVVGLAWFRAATTIRTCSVGIQWYTSLGASISTAFGTGVSDSTSAWTVATFSLNAPATAAYARVVVQAASIAGTGEVHYVDDVLAAGLPTITQLGALQPTPTGQLPSMGAWQVMFRGDGLTANPGLQAQFQNVIGGKGYSLDFWAQSPQGFSGGLEPAVDWYNSLGYISTTSLSATPLIASIPAHITGALIAPLNATAAIFRIFANGTPPATTLFNVAGGVAIGNGNLVLPGSKAGGLTNAPLPGQVTPYVLQWTSSTPIIFQVAWANARYFGSGVDYFPPTTATYDGIGYQFPLADLNIQGMYAVTFWAGFGSSNYFNNWPKKGGLVHFEIILTDSVGQTLAFSRVQKCVGSNNSNAPRWHKIRARMPNSVTFNYSDVVGYAVYVSNHGSDLRYTRVYLSDLEAVPPPTTPDNQPNFGALYDLGHVEGSARAPMTLQAQLPGTATYTQKWTNPGTYGWAAPPAASTVNAYLVGGGGAGHSASPGTNAAQAGGGGGGSAATTGAAVTPGTVYPITVGRGGTGTVIGGSQKTATASTVSFDAVSLTAGAGGNGGATSGGSAGAAGTGGFAGGVGGAGRNVGTGPAAGGGSSGGSAAGGNAGAAASAGGAGGAAVTGGGAGGAGAGSTGFTPAYNGSFPGGGGGGGFGSNSPWTKGGAGGGGEVSITYTSNALLQTLVAHRPSFYAPQEFMPFVPIPITDTPNGATEYPMPSFTSGMLARFGGPWTGTYSVLVCPNSWNGGGSSSSARTITVTVKQYEQNGGQSYSTSIAASITPANLPQLTVPNCKTGFARLGEITLPPNLLPADNLDCYFTVTINDTNTSDSFQDILFLDTMGSTVIVESTVSYQNIWIDEPDVNQDIGNVMGTLFDRADAVSILDRATVSGPPLDVDPYGNRSLLVYALEGNPAVEVSYFPRHFLERPA